MISNCTFPSLNRFPQAKNSRFRPREYEPDEGPWDPISGGATALVGTATQMMMGVADFPIETLKLLNIHPSTQKGKGKASDDTASGPEASKNEGRPTPSNQSSFSGSTSMLPGASTPGSKVDADLGPNDGSRSNSIATAGAPSIDPQAKGPKRAEPGTSFAERLQNINAAVATDTGKGVGRMLGAGFKSPMDFTLNVAKGFHNVPKLMGGEVRQVDKVTDFQSGLKTAGKVNTFSFVHTYLADYVLLRNSALVSTKR